MDDASIRSFGAPRLVAAASAALAADPALIGRAAPTVLARVAAARLCQDAGLAQNEWRDRSISLTREWGAS